MTKSLILVYTDDTSRLALGSLRHALRSSFNVHSFNIQPVTAKDIRDGILREDATRLFILPGIIGEDSIMYQREIRTTEMNEIHRFLDRGRTSVLGICAGAYYLSRYTEYRSPNHELKTLLSSTPLFNGVAMGPMDRYKDSIDMVSGKRMVHLSPVTFKSGTDQWQETSVCYGNGPVLIPDNLAENEQLEVLAYYGRSNEKKDAAIIRLPRGDGSVYLCGVHPEIAHQRIPDALANRNYNAVKLMQDLEPYEPGRRRLWHTMTNRIEMDIQP